MSNARILVTGGSGFIGSSLVKALLRIGCSVRVLDDNSRGRARRLGEVANDIEFIAGDIRDAAAVENAARGMDELHHLAFVNGTEFFYNAPDLVLDVGVRGMINVIDACRKQMSVRCCSASSSKSTRHRRYFPTDESAPLVVRCAEPALFLRRQSN
jgi:nucleoside-diphosphate-sugar epimerase